jgi:hypothetical protein
MKRSAKKLILGTPGLGVEQIGGDFGSPWEYGGTWHDPERQHLIHVDGLDSEHIEDTWPYDIEVPDEVVRRIVRELGGNPDRSYLDADEQQEHYIEREVESAIEDWQTEEASQRDAKVALPVYITTDDFEPWMQAELEGALRDFDPAIHQQLTSTDVGKVLLVAERIGWYEFDSHPEKYTKSELANLLGLPEDKL